eukprot:11221688-Lingulodinium_polyedra.AAC.1
MMRSNRPSAAAAARASRASRTPCERQFLVFACSVRGVRFARRCGRGRSIRPQHCAFVLKPCAMMQSNRPSAGAAARKSH